MPATSHCTCAQPMPMTEAAMTVPRMVIAVAHERRDRVPPARVVGPRGFEDDLRKPRQTSGHDEGDPKQTERGDGVKRRDVDAFMTSAAARFHRHSRFSTISIRSRSTVHMAYWVTGPNAGNASAQRNHNQQVSPTVNPVLTSRRMCRVDGGEIDFVGGDRRRRRLIVRTLDFPAAPSPGRAPVFPAR